MASPFQRYQGGIQPVTGMAEAGANIGKMYQQGLGQLGAAIGEGIKEYGLNQQKSEAADATIASGIARFKSIADVYGQDPEFAPIVAQYAQRLEQYKDAPNQSYAKKAVMANEIGMLGQELAQTLQAQQVVRSRQIERVGGELLNQFKNVEKVTDPAFIKEGTSKFNTGKDYGSNEGEFLTGLNKFRQAAQAAGKEIKGSDAEALDAYRRDVLDSTNKAMSAGTLDKAIGSRIIEQVEAQRSIEKKNAQAKSDMPVLPSMAKSSRKDYEAVTGTAYQPTAQDLAASKFAPEWLIKAAREEKVAGAVKQTKQIPMLEDAQKVSAQVIASIQERIQNGEKVTANDVKAELEAAETANNKSGYVQVALPTFSGIAPSSMAAGYTRYSEKATTFKNPTPATNAIMEAVSRTGVRGDEPLTINNVLDMSKDISSSMQKFNEKAAKLAENAVKAQSQEVKPDMSKAPEISLGKMAVGQVEYERKVNLAEKKAKVADLLTQRIGFTDPATGKKTLPAGFDSWFKQMVPESDARVVDVDGVKLLWNGKGFEQVKMEQAKMPSPKEIGENSAFIFGVQTDKGIQPTELVPDSGVLVGGIVSGSTAGAEKVREQLTDLIDLRSSVSRLQQINDKFGEFASLRDQGISQYDLMKLRAVLTKQVNVSGSISDYERKEIAKMTPDPTAFLDFEPKTRAALLGIALGIDRDIKTLATSRGLSVVMQENGGMTQNQSLRQKFLSKQPQ